MINFDYPNSSEDYVHRIGRTGRQGKEGTSYTLFTSNDMKEANDLIKVLKEANQEIPDALDNLGRLDRETNVMKKKRVWGYAPRSNTGQRSGGGNYGQRSGGGNYGQRSGGGDYRRRTDFGNDRYDRNDRFDGPRYDNRNYN